MPEDGVDLQPQSKMINQQEILRLASMFVDAGVDKIRLTGGEVGCALECTAPFATRCTAVSSNHLSGAAYLCLFDRFDVGSVPIAKA